MADNKYTIWKCIDLDCGHEQIFDKNNYRQDALTCTVCGEAVMDKNEMKKPLLTIELSDIDSIPKVIYKGKKITKRIHVSFDWSTQTDKTVPSPMIDIEYLDTTSSKPSLKRITYTPLGGDSNV